MMCTSLDCPEYMTVGFGPSVVLFFFLKQFTVLIVILMVVITAITFLLSLSVCLPKVPAFTSWTSNVLTK